MKYWVLFIAALSLSCTVNKNYGAGDLAEQAGRYDEAVNYYSRALAEDPGNAQFRRSLDRAKVRAAEAHADRGAKLKAAGEYEAAREELLLALALNPAARHLARELERVEKVVQDGAEAAAQDSIAAIKSQAKESPLGKLSLDPVADQPAGFVFRNASLRDVLISVGKMAGVNVVFDGDYVDENVSIELHDASFEDALRSLCRISGNFYRVETDNIVVVVPDTTAKRREYQEIVTKTFYLSSADLKETIDLLRITLGARRIAPHTNTNALTIVDTPEKIAAAERIITTVDRSRGEVIIEVELMEVSRKRLDEYGIQLTSLIQGVSGIATTFDPADTTLDQPLYQSANIAVSGLPGAVMKLLREDSDTRILASPKLRSVDGQAALVEFGDRVPVPITTFTPIASGGIEQQPVTTFEYENIGVNVEILPRIHHNDDISLALQFRLSAISGTGFGGLPTFGNRSVNTVLRLREGETSLLAGLIRDEERMSLAGTPGLASVPILGRLFSANKKEVQEMDIVLTLTPRLIRRAGLTIEELKSFTIEGGVPGTVIYEAPTPTPPRQPQSQPQRERQRQQPLRDKEK
jgi:general secretion pathway protein D